MGSLGSIIPCEPVDMNTSTLDHLIKDQERSKYEIKDYAEGQEKEEPKGPTVKQLQELLDTTKAAGLPTTEVEAALAKAKQEASQQTGSLNLKAVLGKLAAAEAHSKQLAEQTLKDEERLRKN